MRTLLVVPVAAIVVLLGACTQGAVKPDAVSYALEELNDSGISGVVTFEKLTDQHAAVIIEVDGTTAGRDYPAHIHTGDHPNGGIYLGLSSVAGNSGTSVTVFNRSETNGEDPYEHLANFDGFVNIHNPDNNSVILATGETGAGAPAIQIDRR